MSAISEPKWKANKTEDMQFTVTWIGLALSAICSETMHVLHKQNMKAPYFQTSSYWIEHYDDKSNFCTRTMEYPQQSTRYEGLSQDELCDFWVLNVSAKRKNWIAAVWLRRHTTKCG
jgi:hypothetical protein